MYCQVCGTPARAGGRFCTQCGTPLAQTCPACNGPTQAQDRFCAYCGLALVPGLVRGQVTSAAWPAVPAVAWGVPPAAVVAPPPTAPPPTPGLPPAPPAVGLAPPAAVAPPQVPETAPEAEALVEPSKVEVARTAAMRSRVSEAALARARADSAATSEGERRLVTILMSDVSGFTRMSEHLDPEDVQFIMNQCFDRLVKIITEDYDGWVVKTIGDAIMATFGAPIALEDASERAIRAALDMQRALSDFHVESVDMTHVRLQMRIGINMGEVVAGGVMADGIRKFDVVGTAVNLAARLESAASVGAVLISQSVYDRVGESFEFEATEPLKLKNVSEPVQAYVVKGIRRRETRIGRSLRAGLSRMVGRGSQMKRLTEALDLAQKGRGQVVSICGEAGVGKSRLIHELKQMAEGKKVRTLEGQCLSFGRNISYLPFQDIVRQASGIEELDEPEVQAQKLSRVLQRLGEEMPQFCPVLGSILSLPCGDGRPADLPTEPDERQALVLQAVDMLLGRVSQEAPLLVVFDDLHWVDSSSEELLELFLPQVRGKPMLVVLAHRSDFKKDWGSIENYRSLDLSNLSQDESEELLEERLGGKEIPPAVRDTIVAKAGGNPFYLEEIVRVLEAQGAFDGATAEISLEMIPDTVQEIILARLDRLAMSSEASRQVLQTASVIGSIFRADLLRQVVGLDVPVEEHLEGLAGLDFIYARSTGPEAEYGFEAQLTYDVVYNSILKRRRSELHSQVGAQMEKMFAGQTERYAEILVHHFDVGNRPDRAIHYLQISVSKNLLQGAFREVVVNGERAVQLLAELEPRENYRGVGARFYANMCYAKAMTGRAPEAVEDGHRALELALPGGDKVAESYAAEKLALAYAHTGEYERAKQYYRLSMKIREVIGDREGIALCRQGILSILWTTGDYEGARRGYEEVLEEERQISAETLSTKGEIAALVCLGSTLEKLGEYQAALGYFGEAEELVREAGDEVGEAYMRANMGDAEFSLGRHRVAFDYYRQALDMFIPMEHKTMEANMLKDLGRCQCELGFYEEALEKAQQALEIARSIGDVTCEVEASVVSAQIRLWLGLVEEAFDQASRALELAKTIGNTQAEADAARTLGLIRLRRGDGEGSAEAFQTTLLRSREMLNRKGQAASLCGYGYSWLLQNEPDAAVAAFNEALSIAELLGARLVTIESLLGRARAYTMRGRADQAIADLTSCIDVAVQIGHPEILWRAFADLARLRRREKDLQAALDNFVKALEVAKRIAAHSSRHLETCPAALGLVDLQTETISLLWEMGAVTKPTPAESALVSLLQAPSLDKEKLRKLTPELDSLVQRMLEQTGLPLQPHLN